VVFSGFSADAVQERLEFSEAKALVTVDSARRKARRRRSSSRWMPLIDDLETLERIIVVRHTGDDCEMKEGRDVWYSEIVERGRGVGVDQALTIALRNLEIICREEERDHIAGRR
jgi:acyl-coenzyme A synthetase/AMP-(fatty) acid ligase